MRLDPRGEFLQKSWTMPTLASGGQQFLPSNPTGKGKGQRFAVFTEEILVFRSFLGFRPAKMPGLQDRVGGRRRGGGGGEKSFVEGRVRRSKGREAAAPERAQRP